MTTIIKEIQVALNEQGFDCGEADGILGRRTIKAVESFQIQHPGLIVDGIPGPRTLAVLFKNQDKPQSINDKLIGMPWLDLAITKKGLNENKNNSELRKFLKSDGSSIGDPAQIPWCGDFVETCIALTLKNEILPGNPYLARNWAKFGQKIHPTLGAIAAFWRGTPKGINGHVAFLVGEGPGVYYILGGNQSNQVSVTKIAMTRMIDSRWPLTAPMPNVFQLPTMKDGKLSINEA